MALDDEQLHNWFQYHPPTTEQAERYARLRAAAFEFARVVVKLTPPSPDQTAAIRKIREAVMTANAAIACEERGAYREEAAAGRAAEIAGNDRLRPGD